ncbi:hypothetical protein KAJ27_07150 [bacterium]|nr:hypothetical protein [bacterium]
MRKLFIIILVFAVINSGFVFCADLQTRYFTAEGYYHNKMFEKALEMYQEILSECGKNFKYHKQVMERIITIMNNQNRSKNILKEYCFLYKTLYPNDEFTKIVSGIISQRIAKTKKIEKKPVKVVKVKKSVSVVKVKKIEESEFSAEHFRKMDSVISRFQEGYWVTYEIDNLQKFEIRGNYDKLTYAIIESNVVGSKVNCKLLVLFEGPFKKLQLIYTVSFKEIDDYYIKDVSVKVPGERTKTVDGSQYEHKLPLIAASHKDLMKDGTKVKSGYRNVKVKNLKFVEFKYNIDPSNKGYVIYSPQVPISGVIDLKGKNPTTFSDYYFKLIDYGYTGGKSFVK